MANPFDFARNLYRKVSPRVKQWANTAPQVSGLINPQRQQAGNNLLRGQINLVPNRQNLIGSTAPPLNPYAQRLGGEVFKSLIYSPESKKLFPTSLLRSENQPEMPRPTFNPRTRRMEYSREDIQKMAYDPRTTNIGLALGLTGPISKSLASKLPVNKLPTQATKGAQPPLYDIAKEPRVQGQMKNLSEAGKKMTIDAEMSRRPVINEPDMDYILRRAGASPDEIASGKITVYRATENGKILPGDFVSPDKSVLKPYFDQRVETGRTPKIVSQKVDIKDLVIGDEVTDFVYRPTQNVKMEDIRTLVDSPRGRGESLSPLAARIGPQGSVSSFDSPTTPKNVPQGGLDDISELQKRGLASGFAGDTPTQASKGVDRTGLTGKQLNIPNEKLYQPNLSETLDQRVARVSKESGYTPGSLQKGTGETGLQPQGMDPAATSYKTRFQVQQEVEQLSKPPSTPQAKARPYQSLDDIVPNFKDEIKNVPPTKKVNLTDYIRTPDRVLKKIGLGQESQLLKDQYRKYQIELPKEIAKVTEWAKRAPDKGASQRIFKYLDGQEVQLKPNELKVADEIRVYLKEWAGKLGLPEDKQIKNYITHLFDDQLIQKEFDPDLAALIQDQVPGSVYDPFLQKRYGIGGFKEDAWQALDAYIKRGVRKYNMDPALDQLKKASEKLEPMSLNYVKRLGARINLRPTEIDNLIDNFIKSTPVGYRMTARPVAYASRKIRQTIYRGALGMNVGSAVRNLTQGANTYAKLGERYAIKGYMDMFADMVRNGDELKRVGVLSDNIIQDRSMNATKKFWEKADKGLFFMFDFAERINRGAAYFGAKAKALSKGLSEEDAIKAGIKMVEDTQFTFGSVDTPLALQSDLIKVATQFQSYGIKQTEFLAEMIKNKEFGGALRFVGANLVMIATFGKLFGMKWQDMIPFYETLKGGKFPASPAVQAVQGLGGAMFGDEDQKAEGVKKLKGLGKLLIPGGAQINKTLEGVGAVNEGASLTPTGRVRFEVEKTPENYAKGALFGQYNLPGAREYFDNMGKSKAQIAHEKLKKLPKEQAAAEFDRLIKENPDLAKEVIEYIKDEQLGLTPQERKIRNLPIKDGSRPRAIAKLFKNKSQEEKAKLWEDLVKKKVITKEVARVLNQMKEAGKL